MMGRLGARFCRFWRELALALAVVAAPVPGLAATIELSTTQIDGEELSFITIEGDLEYGDELRFADLAIGVQRAAVFFASEGGNLHAGIEIGRAIRLKGFATFVAAPYSCASACALAWLGGTPRFMSEDYAVGFHAAWRGDDPGRSADSVGNALVGAYLGQLGLTPVAIRYVTEAQPDGMQWLTFADAEAVGIEVVALAPDDAEAERPVAVGPPATDDWASYGDWIQIYSRQSLHEAIELGMAYQREFPGTFVFRYDNGWYVIALGPYPPGAARREKDRLVAARRIPRDSLVNHGERFLELVWGAAPENPAVSARPSAEDIALGVAEDYFRTWSGPNGDALAFLGRTYAPQVEYFGKRVARSEVMREKAEFVERWPQRTYTLRSGVSVHCSMAQVCSVHGLVDWRAYSPARNSTSVGTASFTLSFRVGGLAPSLVSETSKVLDRQTRRGR